MMVSTSRKTRSSRETAVQQLDLLIADARAGSAAALDQLIEQLSMHLWAELAGRTKPRGLGPSHGLSDLIQDTLVRVRQKFSKFERHTFAEFKQWARAVLHRRRQEWIRNFRARNSADKKERIWLAIRNRVVDGTRGERDPAQHREETKRADAAFASLKPNERFIINLRLLEGLRYKQIAAMTGWNEEASRKAYDRAIARLKQLFDSNGKL
jgi:RNA polymerase sigma factor (sigma-70 family)